MVSTASEAFQALRMLPKQLDVLRASDEESRQALQQWSQLQQHWCALNPLTAVQQLEAAESAAWLLQRLVTQQVQQQMLCEGDVQEVQQQCEESIAAAQQQFDELAAAAQEADPQAFGTPAAAADQRLHQLEALKKVLFQQAKLRNAPFEWVYDGLAPALLPQVLQRSKGMPLSLALVAAAVGRRLGMQLQLLCAPEGTGPTTASGPLLQQQLPPEVAARQGARTTASAPSPDYWLLRLLPPAGHVWQQDQPVYLDVSQNGKLLDATACVSRYPQLEGLLQEQQGEMQQAALQDSSSQVGWLPPQPPMQSAVLQAPSVVAVWASLARSMVTAHQRRGESDFVAQWLYQLLALDTQAPEWAHVIQ